jgi:hypothetical protein
MNKGTKSKVDINKKEPYKQPPYDYNSVQVTITPDEREYLVDMALILSKLMVNETKTPLLPDNTLSSLGKMVLSFITNIFCTQVLTQSEIAAHLPDKQALNEFITFRKKYMNFPVDKQIADLKRVGIVTQR